jgi:exopolysaccharide/PEP-CTERM locus tyrosine autokinase
MSIVEKALKKLQDQAKESKAQSAVSPLQNAVFGQVVTHVAPERSGEVKALNTPTRIVQIDTAALRAAGLLPPQHQERQIGEQYRQIKRPLVMSATGRGGPKLPLGHLIMMASALPGEGKTFTSINLAFSMALEKDIRVLLVDADVAKPHISKLLGIQAEPGLLDLLRDPSLDIESVVLPTDVKGLSLLPAGRQGPDATELLASSRMRDVTQRIAERDHNRVALIDSPPLLLTTESYALSQAVGQIVLVVRAGVTPQDAVQNALQRLGDGKHISLVLNQSVVAPTDGYYYGYGQSSQDAKAS